MHIALDVSNAARPQPTGIAMYIRHLVNAMIQNGSEHQFTLVNRLSRWKHRKYFVRNSSSNVTSKIIQEPFHPFFSKKVDLFHGLDARIPGPWMKAKLVVTIHDIYSAMQSKEFATDSFRALKAKRYQDILERADQIIAVSEASKKDFAQTFETSPDRIHVIHEAADFRFSPQSENEIQSVRSKHSLDRPYIIYIGSLNKRKNIPAMLKAFLLAKERTGSDALFALSGRIGFGGEEIQQIIEQHKGQEHIRWLGYVPDEDIPCLYSGALGLLFATLYEGFGIPVLEAFSCGCPVVGGSIGSAPEIIQDAGLIADPGDLESIATQVEKLLGDEALRNTLKQKGLTRAKDFSWEKSARQYLDLYGRVLGDSS